MERPVVYLDHNASAPLLPQARDALAAALELPGNPSSIHAPGRALRSVIDDGRDRVAALAGANPEQVVFTGSATEAITQAIVGGCGAFTIDRVVVSAAEHAAVLKAAEVSGAPVETLAVSPEGVIDHEALAETLARASQAGETVLVALHWVNNETGVVQPLETIEAIVGPTPHVLFVDAVQGFGKLALDFSARATDMMAVSGHKIGGPAGVGALLVKSHADTVRLIPGGGQEKGRRGGTESAALIAGFGAACDAFPRRCDRAGLGALRDRLEAWVSERCPKAVIFSAGTDRLETVSCFAVPGLRNTVALMGLDLEGVAISSGSACSSGKVARSHVLGAMGIDPALADCALRVSLGWSTTPADITRFCEAFETILLRHEKQREHAA